MNHHLMVHNKRVMKVKRLGAFSSHTDRYVWGCNIGEDKIHNFSTCQNKRSGSQHGDNLDSGVAAAWDDRQMIIPLCSALSMIRQTSVESKGTFPAAGLFITKLWSWLSDKSINCLSFITGYYVRMVNIFFLYRCILFITVKGNFCVTNILNVHSFILSAIIYYL